MVNAVPKSTTIPTNVSGRVIPCPLKQRMTLDMRTISISPLLQPLKATCFLRLESLSPTRLAASFLVYISKFLSSLFYYRVGCNTTLDLARNFVLLPSIFLIYLALRYFTRRNIRFYSCSFSVKISVLNVVFLKTRWKSKEDIMPIFPKFGFG